MAEGSSRRLWCPVMDCAVWKGDGRLVVWYSRRRGLRGGGMRSGWARIMKKSGGGKGWLTAVFLPNAREVFHIYSWEMGGIADGYTIIAIV